MDWFCKTKHSGCEHGTTPKRWLAFSLIELMAVVAIIGVLVSLALPRFRTFVARARMAEATHNLGVIQSLQKSYILHQEMLGNDGRPWCCRLMGRGYQGAGWCGSADLKNKLGFRVEDCTKLRYSCWSGDTVVLNGLINAYLGASLPVGATNEPSSVAHNNGEGVHRIYPGCHGIGKHDAWSVRSGSGKKLQHLWDIVEECE